MVATANVVTTDPEIANVMEHFDDVYDRVGDDADAGDGGRKCH